MTDPDRKLWDGMLAHLRKHYVSLCRQWFEHLEPLGITAGALHLRARSAPERDYLRRSCAEAFNEAAVVVSGHLLSVRFLGPEEEFVPAPMDARRNGFHRPAVFNGAEPLAPRARPEREDALAVNPDYCFENFVVGSENRLAHAAAFAVAQNPGKVYNPLFIHGGVGLGKTHLLQAICLEIHARNPGATIYYISCDGFINQFMESVRGGEMAEFRHRFRDVDLLVIDDIHFLTKRDRTQEEFFHTFNSLFQAQRQIVLSSDAPPGEIPDLEDRLVSRFKSGLVAEMGRPCFETRVEIVKAKARLREVNLGEGCAEYIAERIDSNIRELEGAIVKVQMLAHVHNRAIDIDLTRQAIGEPDPRAPAEPSIQVIIGAVSEFFRVRPADLLSKRRQRSVAVPRQVCMYLARLYTRHSHEEIGLSFGGRHHTTVMHSVKIVEDKKATDPEFSTVIRTLEEKIRSSRDGR